MSIAEKRGDGALGYDEENGYDQEKRAGSAVRTMSWTDEDPVEFDEKKDLRYDMVSVRLYGVSDS